MVIEAKGHNGQLSFDGFFISIRRKGFIGRATVGKGEKRIPLSAITAVQIKPAGVAVNGYIQFTLGGGNERRSKFGSQTVDAMRDENSVVFTYYQREQILRFRDAIEAAMAAGHQQSAAAPVPIIPAAWYSDPWLPGGTRYHDGQQWTTHVQPPAAP